MDLVGVLVWLLGARGALGLLAPLAPLLLLRRVLGFAALRERSPLRRGDRLRLAGINPLGGVGARRSARARRERWPERMRRRGVGGAGTVTSMFASPARRRMW